MEELREVKREKWYNEKASSDREEELFDNLIVSNKKSGLIEGYLNQILDRLEQVCILIGHKYFNEVEAARFLRLPEPSGQGRETIKNYALRHKKLSFHKVGRSGLIFERDDLVRFLEVQKIEAFHESQFL